MIQKPFDEASLKGIYGIFVLMKDHVTLWREILSKYSLNENIKKNSEPQSHLQPNLLSD